MKLIAVWRWMKEETLRVLPAVIYFAVAFNLIYYITGLALEPGEKRYFTPWMVTVGALIVGKVLLIANMLPFINAFPKKPLIYNIAWKFFIYSLLLFFVGFIEIFFHLVEKYHGTQEMLFHLKHEYTSPLFWSSELWLSLVFLIFLIFSEFIRVIGRDRVLEILLGSKQH